MRRMGALVRAQWLAASSYRVRLVLSFASLAAVILPVYFVSGALQPVLANAIQNEGGNYFGFLLIGLGTFYFVTTSVNDLPNTIGGGLNNGTLEAMLSTPIRLPSLIAGLSGFGFLFTGLRALALFIAGWALGAAIQWDRFPLALLIIALIVLAHIPFGIIASSLVIMFRTPAGIPQGITMLSVLLGGVYYPTKVIPSWIQNISSVLPLTYGLRALRHLLLDRAPVSAIAGDVGMLALFAAGLLLASGAALTLAMRYARRTGSLSQY